MKMLKIVLLSKILTSFAILVFLSSISSAGGSHGGGGSGAVMPSGEIRLVDLLSDQGVAQATELGLGHAQVLDKFYRPQQFVRQAAVVDMNFFRCASDIFEKKSARLPVLTRLNKTLAAVRVLQIEFQILTSNEGADYDSLRLNYPLLSTASHRLPLNRQVSLATYANNQLWISRRLASKLSTFDQCGLSVHEGLRHLNFSNLLVIPLTQDEIESATRLFMGLEIDCSIEKIITKKLSKEMFTSEEYFKAALNWNQKATSALNKMLALGARPLNDAAATLWDQESALYQNELNFASAQNSKMTANSIVTDLDAPSWRSTVSTGIVERAMVDGTLIHPLQSGKRWDVINYKFVTH